MVRSNQTIKLTTIPNPAINIALAPFIEIAPLLPDPPIPVDDGFEPELEPEPEPYPVVVAFVEFVAFPAN